MPGVPDKVVLHPLVLLSVVDHYNRVAKDTKKRVVGVLLGETYKGQVDVTNSFAGRQAGYPLAADHMLQVYAVHLRAAQQRPLRQQRSACAAHAFQLFNGCAQSSGIRPSATCCA
jgi:hypothetical protein